MSREGPVLSAAAAARRKILVIRSVNVHETARALQHLRARCPEAEMSLLLPRHLMEYLAESPSVDRFLIYEDHSRGPSWRRAITLIRNLRKERFDDVVILCPSQTRIATLYDIILFSLFIPAKRRIILDGRLQESDLSFGHRLKVVGHNFLLLLASAVASLVTLLLVTIIPASRSGDRPRRRRLDKLRKIAILVPILPDISHTFVYREVLAMKRYGAEFVVIALEEGDHGVLHPEAKELLECALFVPKPSLGRYVLYYLYFSLRFPRRMAELIRLYQPHAREDPLVFVRVDQYHNSLHPMHGIGLAYMLRQLGVTSLHVHGSTYPTTRAMTASCLLDIPFSTHAFVDFDFEYDFKMLREKLSRSAFFVTHTDFCRARLLKVAPDLDPGKIHTIRIGVDPSQWRPALSRAEGPALSAEQRRSAEGPQASNLVAVCRFVEKKGLDVLLGACAILKERKIPFRCLLIGDGPETGRLQSLVAELRLEEEVRFLGAIPTDRVRSYLIPNNVIVVPSVYAKDGERDGTPTVLIEAMASGVPVVASGISGIPELIDDGESGILVPSRDEEKLASAIEALLTNPELRARLRGNGRRKVLKEFDVRVNALRVWRIILKEHYPELNHASP
jgi:glycosyltransferase involved in cell wall biosynthesis